MRIAFLNMCHCEPEIVARVARRLCSDEEFDMYIHVDAKQDILPFQQAISGIRGTFFTENRYKVFWGGYNAILATMELIRCALSSERDYDYIVTLQNLDYPIRSNDYIKSFFIEHNGTEFIRGCNIAHTNDKEFNRKYKLYYRKDTPLGGKNQPKVKKLFYNGLMIIMSISTLGCNGVIREKDCDYDIYYGCAQWSVTRNCAKYILDFYYSHPKFNRKMARMQFPDEEYPHTVVHNSYFKDKCYKYDEPLQRWLVNWRNNHYFEFPKEVTVLDDSYIDILRKQGKEILFCRKVKSGISDSLLDILDSES